KSGGAFDKAVAAAPVQSQLNSAYANLQVPQSAPLAVPPQQQHVAPAAAGATSQILQANNPVATGQERMALATPAVPVGLQAATPQVVNNPAAIVGNPASPTSVAAAPALPVAMPKQVNNPYLGLT